MFKLLTIFEFVLCKENDGLRYSEISIIVRVDTIEQIDLQMKLFLVICEGVGPLIEFDPIVFNFKWLCHFLNDTYDCSTAIISKLVELFRLLIVVEV